MGNRISRGTCTINGKQYHIHLNKKKNIAIIKSEHTKFYKGEFKNESLNGHGILFWENGKKRYAGEWEDGEIHGSGISYYENGCVEFKGEFGGTHHQEGSHGYVKGKLYYNNGKIMYDGEFMNGRRHGKGTLYYEDGLKFYDGEWDNDNRHGEGSLYEHHNVKVYDGIWENDKPTDLNAYIEMIPFGHVPHPHYEVTDLVFE